MSARATLAATLATALDPEVDIVEYARDGLTLTARTVMLRVDEVQRYSAAPLARRRYVYALILAVPQTSTHGPADERLDAFLEEVLAAIEAAGTLPQWTTCRRGTYGKEYPAYEVVLPVDFRITDTTAPQE